MVFFPVQWHNDNLGNRWASWNVSKKGGSPENYREPVRGCTKELQARCNQRLAM
ncbi:hypothetical protein M404DRAFT_1003708, partial [Pisolithus tinctorius Marx 270]